MPMVFASALERWREPGLASYLEPDEHVLAGINAFSGLLAYPLFNSGPMFGSTRWDIALTDRRLIAVEHPFVPWLRRGHRKALSVQLSDVSEAKVFWDWGMQANVKFVALDRTYEFKIWGFPRETYGFTKEMRRLAKQLEGERLNA